ncbi:MAG TPA: hypothetical protein ENH70_03515 [Desulfobacteraceae bacterium]|nr:hypothetical protein [Desulfobacteraceae bacterium]
MKKITLMVCLMGALLFNFGIVPSNAAEVDVLINKLVEKGILSQQEAGQLLKEMQKEGSRQETAEKVAKETAEKTVKKESQNWANIPKWVEKIQIKGDFRLRYQYQDKDLNDGTTFKRNRGRYRYRLYVKYPILDNLKVGFSLASGTGDPRSTNQTFTNSFEVPKINLYTAYIQYRPIKQVKIIGGQFKNPVYFASKQDLTWDTDIRPQGIAAPIKGYFIPKKGYWFVTPAWYILNEFKGEEETTSMGILQAGIGWDVTDHFWFKFAPGYFYNMNVKGNDFKWSSGSNTRNADGNLIYEYNSFTLDGEFGWQKLPGYIKLVNVFAQFISSDADDDSKGWLAGIRFGRKIKKLWDWQFRYSYRYLEKDAWLDFLPDSDAYGGKTNAKGHEVRFNLGLNKDVVFAIDYYNMRKIDYAPGDTSEPENVLQVDMNFKF